MNTRMILVAAALIIAVASITPRSADAQAFTEFRDPLRGVTFYSVQIKTDPMMELQHEGSQFSQSDQMTLGLSAFFFDESDTIDEYVLWLRHDGPRRWFTGSRLHPLDLIVDDVVSTPPPLHTLRSEEERAGPFIEKLEFALTPGAFSELLGAETVTLHLNTLLGSLDKTLTADEMEVMQRFRIRVMSAHEDARFSSLNN